MFFFQALKGNCEKCCIFRLNWWGPTPNLKLSFLDSSHTNNHLYIIYQSIMEMLTYFHRMSLNKNCGCMIFSVAYQYRKSMSIIERVIYISSSWHHIFAIPPVFIEIYRVGDNRRPVNSSTSLHICDQLGTGNVWETLLCWFIVVLWVLVCKKYVSIWTSFWIFPPVLVTAHVSDCAIELTEAGNRSGTKTS